MLKSRPEKARQVTKVLVFLLCLAPFARLAWRFWMQD